MPEIGTGLAIGLGSAAGWLPVSLSSLAAWYRGHTETQLTDAASGQLREIHEGRCYNGDGSDDYLQLPFDLLATDIVSHNGSGSITGDTVNNRLNLSGTIADIVVRDSGSAIKAQYYCDEGGGYTAYDASGNGNHALLAFITPASFHTTDNGFTSYQNTHGYSEGINFIGYGEDLSDTTWIPSSGVSGALNGDTAPDGEVLTTVSKGSNSFASLNQILVNGMSGSTATLRLIAKAGTNTSVSWYLTPNGSSARASRGHINLSDGSVTQANTSGDVSNDITVTLLSDGSYEIIIKVVFTNVSFNTSARLYVYPDIYNASNAGNVLIGGVQLQEGISYTRYQKTASAATGGALIPVNTTNASQDALGNSADYTGAVKLSASLAKSHCATFDGNDDILVFAGGLATGTMIISYGGTAVPSIDTANDQITCTAGTLYNLVLSDGTHLPLAEGSGTTAYDASGNGNHATITNSGSGFWADTQDSYHYNLLNGFEVSGAVKVPAGASSSVTNPAGDWHNDAETVYQFPSCPELEAVDSQFSSRFFYAGTNGASNDVSYADIVADYESADLLFANVATSGQKRDIIASDSPITGDSLSQLESFLDR